MFYKKPIFFEQNRVFRVYTGGKLMGKFLGKNFEDDFYPEEWVCSAVRAMNEGSTDIYEGVSKIEGEDLYFNDAINKYKKEILGDADNVKILVKYLDSAIRLPVQAHPTKAFSREYFNSDHGKEESWYILDTRPNACVYFGFKEGITKEKFMDAIEKSETDKTVMEDLLVRHEVKKGDVIFIPANTVHAIGAGCLILEVQEPTDFTVQPERWCGDYKLSDYQMYLGLDKEVSMKCFDFKTSPNSFLTPKEVYNKDG
ncbi:MAG: class I mannose-6-phosphate isomerase, partial [Clostridia bacterium]|nr:class I mannose-6-phosphate isomerase [Clostridia bacterium]